MNNAIDIARRLAELNQTKEACTAYTLALHQSIGVEPEQELEAAAYLFQYGEDYKVSYTTFRDLYNRGFFKEDILNIMTQAFYEPNVKLMKRHYEKNCQRLSKYPYLFRKDFLPFEELPIRFYPYDDFGYVPFYVEEERFGEYVNLNHPVISRNFFCDLEKPILAADVFSQYELEYLKDNVRRSDWVARENHIYLHYTNWGEFCAHLAVWNWKDLLEEEKFVFLIGEEVAQYPIDFKERFGLDYSQCEIKPLGIREVNRLIWHTQLSSHNGGDFFNEIFHGHPNLIHLDSTLFSTIKKLIEDIRAQLKGNLKKSTVELNYGKNVVLDYQNSVLGQLSRLSQVTDKDILVALYLGWNLKSGDTVDRASRIVPALFFQPHFYNIHYTLSQTANGETLLQSEEYDHILASSIFRGFKYIKTFTPLRRMTTSYAATLRFMLKHGKITDKKITEDSFFRLEDMIAYHLMNRSFMIDWQTRLFKDCTLVRFEDGKLNPKATFTALAAFLDLPYTESMTYCSDANGINPESMAGNVRGFDPASVYRTYDEYANDTERCLLEYFMRDVYETYGYDFQYYNGEPADEAWLEAQLANCTTMDRLLEENLRAEAEHLKIAEKTEGTEEDKAKEVERYVDNGLGFWRQRRAFVTKLLLKGLYFVNRNGQPLRLMPMLKLDPELLEQPLYR